MPTMTRMHRHSSSNAMEETRGRRRNASGDANKENFGVHFMSSPFGNSSLIALQDLSNVHGKSPQRRSFSEGSGPRQATPQLAALRCLPRIGGAGAGPGAALEDSQLSSSRMGDTTLDRMLDAIIESARKEVRCKHQTVAATPVSTGEWSESSIHEMEVRTPTHLRRQRVVRRKNQHKPTAMVSGNTVEQRRHAKVKPQGELEQIPSTKRCLSFSSSSSDLEDLEEEHFAKRASMRSSGSSASASSSSSSCISRSTSTHNNNNNIINLAGNGGESSARGSIDMSIAYNAQLQQLNVHVIRCRDLQRPHNAGSINAYVKVALADAGSSSSSGSIASSRASSSTGRFQRTAVHRHSSRPYFDERFSFALEESLVLQASTQLQLAVWHRDRHLNEFLGCLQFPLSALLQQSQNHGQSQGQGQSQPSGPSAGGTYKLQAQECLHSCRSKQHAAYVTPTSSRPQQKKEQKPEEKKKEEEKKQPEQQEKQQQDQHLPTAMTTVAASLKANANDDVISISIDRMTAVGTGVGVGAGTGAKEESQQSLSTASQQPMVLSKKALHQRDADENLFLRFLELDPPADGNANNTTAAGAAGGANAAGGGGGTAGGLGSSLGSSAANANASNANHMNGGSTRRSSTMPGSGGGGGGGGRHGSTGRTPFTMTKRLTRTEERGFGFSIVWTHPPRVEKVEAGLSADRSGILPGDYVIFVDKHNVVTMPEADVLNLIRSQGSTLTLEIFRRSGAGASMAGMAFTQHAITTVTVNATSHSHSQSHSQNSTQYYAPQQQQTLGEDHPALTAHPQRTRATQLQLGGHNATTTTATTLSRPATACSGTTSSIEAAKRRLHLPQVTFSKESIVPITDNRRRFLLQLISREQNFTAALHFGVQRFVQPLMERKDLISPNDHRTLFQNIDELLRIAEDILEQLCNSNDQEQEPHMNFASRVYLSKTTAICAAYKKYCNGIKRADCVLVNKSRQTGSEFISFITEPAVPRKRPDLTMFIHRPLQHFREILKLMQLLASNCHVDTEEHKNFSTVIAELQAAYREITVSSGLMEPLGEGRPLLTLQDLESRMVFTKCKPFTLAVQGRQWIFGGDLSRVEGRSIKPYWTLLFSDIIVFAKVSRDRVLFITEEPIPIANVVDSCFHMRKKTTEFRLTVDPNGRLAESPTGYCAPDLTRTPKRGARRKSLILRAPSLELKAVWQNLLQRQIFLVNAALGSTPLSSPLDSPDVLNTLVPLSDIGMTSASMGSMKLPSLDSINLKQQKQQVRLFRSKRLDSGDSYENLQRLASALVTPTPHSHSQGHNHGQGHGHAVEQIELLIDEKCRILNKTGTPKSSALHLANWMKGQLDKQQQQARLAAIARSQENVSAEDEQLIFNSDSEQDERITYWTRQQLEKRTKELNLAKENGGLSAKPNFGGKRLSGVEELSMSGTSEIYSEAEVVTSQISQSHSTTSDSQITVRSSPIVLDKLAVCRHCHKNCQQNAAAAAGTAGGGRGAGAAPVSPGGTSSALLCNSLKVQHSQSSPNRCCKLNGAAAGVGAATAAAVATGGDAGTGTATGTGSVTSISSSTITGELSSKVVASSSRRETGDTESDVAQLITDELSLSQSEATDDSVGAMPNSSSSSAAAVAAVKLRVLEAPGAPTSPMANGHCSGASACVSGSASAPASSSASASGSPKAQPQPPPRRTRQQQLQAQAQQSQEPVRPRANQQVKAIVTITETARIMRSSDRTATGATTGAGAGSGAASVSGSPSKYTACHCRCAPEDFTQAQLAPDKMEQQTCKLLESPKQKAVPRQEDEQLSLMLIGLAQLAPAARLLAGQQAHKQAPTIAVVPPTPDSVLTKTSTHVWDNSGGAAAVAAAGGTGTGTGQVTTATTSTSTTKQPRQAIIENIPEDSCDESPLEEEPPYRPMSNALRRFGTMSSLEKLPSDELDDDLEPYTQNGLNEEAEAEANAVAENEAENDNDDDIDNDEDYNNDNDNEDADDEDAGAEGDAEDVKANKALAQNLYDLAGCSSAASISVTISNGEVLASGAWTNRAGAFVSDKMSFFEESRAFIDKYLGRWNANEQSTGSGQGQGQGNQTASETDEQMDECTSGATSGEEVWGTPTSGGDNDDMQLINSENTHSSPTKSSTSLNDDDDTELMMDELLMAPPMTASTIRGLLPRYVQRGRRLEPLFEEETESDEEKTQQDSDDIKKGEATTNGHYLEDLAGSSSDEAALAPRQQRLRQQEEEEEEEDVEEEEEDADAEPHSSEERLLPNLATTVLGPRPLATPLLTTTTMLLPTTAITAPSPTRIPIQQAVAAAAQVQPQPPPPPQPLPPPVASSCEYLLEQRRSVSTATSSTTSATSTMTATTRTTNTATPTMPPTTTTSSGSGRASSASAAPATTASQAPSSTTTTISNASDTISSAGRASVKPPRFIPPPPPPRRLLLTQTNLNAAVGKTQQPQRKFGATADSGSSAAVADVASASPTIGIGSRTTPAANTRTSAPSAASAAAVPLQPSAPVPGEASGPKRPSSTIIETCLLGAAAPAGSATSSATASRMARPMRASSSPSSSLAAVAQPAGVAAAPPPQPQPPAPAQPDAVGPRSAVAAPTPHAGCGLSPRLEMRLALNHDILGDEDLICYEPGPDLTTILGHDLSTFHRLTGRDLLSRSATNRVQPKEAVISYSQHRNSKMDTPTVNRRPRPAARCAAGTRSRSSSSHGSPHAVGSARAGGAPPRQPPSPSTWNSSASAARDGGASASAGDNSTSYNNSSGASKLGDLEILARREKIFCMSQSRSGFPARATFETTTKTMTTMTTATTITSATTMTTTTTTAMRRDCSLAMSRAAAAASPTRTTSITSMDAAAVTATATTTTTTTAAATTSMTEAFLDAEAVKSNRLLNFIKRRNSEITAGSSSVGGAGNPHNSDNALGDHAQLTSQSQSPSRSQLLRQSPDAADMAQMSPRKDNDKPSLNRRLWKQITKRRRTNSVSQIVAG
ncbi:hypothetical protein KR222_009046 [Zaprionus bogoriensis]|nr:hypothetical protein KR222_009046 [Zaprionus bogoriensis]